MTDRPIDARDWLFEVEDTATSTWLPISGLNTFRHNPGENRESTETTDFDSNGEYEEDTMQTGATIVVEGRREHDSVTGAQNAGQAYVDTEWAPGKSADSHNQIRFRHETQTTTWTVWDATVTPGEQGGGNNDKTSWSATFRRSGAATSMAVV